MKPHPTAADDAGSFTVVMPDVLRERFERWLRRNHLQVRQHGGDPAVHVVTLPGDNQRRR